MKKHVQLSEGQKLVFKGKGFEGFDSSDPYLVFLGYDSGGWTDLWVDYQGKKLMVRTEDVELSEENS
ncbi:hypothetical protein [Desertivirga brevis]|uniref:hypothetical protein n=1 Tax=Desertivirga brevis TaxID=2810310 RepID=UPI001A957AE1|nr:hypothetical protein [Pedobacter sp. SYSU D00873]